MNTTLKLLLFVNVAELCIINRIMIGYYAITSWIHLWRIIIGLRLCKLSLQTWLYLLASTTQFCYRDHHIPVSGGRLSSDQGSQYLICRENTICWWCYSYFAALSSAQAAWIYSTLLPLQAVPAVILATLYKNLSQQLLLIPVWVIT
jgi:hypothetical protein